MSLSPQLDEIVRLFCARLFQQFTLFAFPLPFEMHSILYFTFKECWRRGTTPWYKYRSSNHRKTIWDSRIHFSLGGPSTLAEDWPQLCLYTYSSANPTQWSPFSALSGNTRAAWPELLLLSLSAKPHPQSYSFRPPPLSPTTHCEPLSISDARVDRRLFGPIICVVALQANVSGSKVGHSISPSYLSLELHDLSTVISGKNLKVPSRRVPAGIYVSINVDSRRCWKPVISILSSSESVAWGDTVTL
jgi:hypothetical protein